MRSLITEPTVRSATRPSAHLASGRGLAGTATGLAMRHHRVAGRWGRCLNTPYPLGTVADVGRPADSLSVGPGFESWCRHSPSASFPFRFAFGSLTLDAQSRRGTIRIPQISWSTRWQSFKNMIYRRRTAGG